jgi:hypothetical protein
VIERLQSWVDDGSFGLTTAVFVGLLVLFLLERVALLKCWQPYYSLGFSGLPEMVPVPSVPEGQGDCASVRWRVESQRVIWWAVPRSGRAPMGLHGCTELVGTVGSFRLNVRWAPPWTPLLALAWFAGIGLARGEGYLTVPVGVFLIGLIIWMYRSAALRAAAEIRWAIVSGSGTSLD